MSTDERLPPLSPETAELYLAPWLDGALPPDTAAQVEEFVNNNQDLAALAAAMASVDAGLPGAFGAVVDAPLPLALARTAAQPAAQTQAAPAARQETGEVYTFPDAVRKPPRAARHWVWPAVAACLLAVVVGGGPTTYFAGRDAGEQAAAARSGWLGQVAAYHRVYAREGRHLVEVGPEEADHIRKWLSARIGAEVSIPDFKKEGLEFAGARMLVAAGKPVAQLMYVQADGLPVGYCLIAQDKPDAGVEVLTDDDLGMTVWRMDGVGHVVIGWETPERLRRIAALARAA